MEGSTKKLGKRVAVGLLTLSSAGLIAISQYEGYSDKVYIPVEGDRLTAGFGHAGDDIQRLPIGTLILKSQAYEWLAEDTKTAQDAVKRCVKVPLSQIEFDSFTSFAFNVGTSAFCNSTLVKKLNAGDYYGACTELKRWIYSGGKAYEGLKNRRQMEFLTCTEGKYPQDK